MGSTNKCLEFPWPKAPAVAERQIVADGVSWVCMPLPFALNHVNIWLLDTDDGVVVIDTGVNSAQTIEIWSSLLEKLPSPPVGLLVTHYHPDHTGLASWLSEQYAMPVWFSEQELEYSRRAFSISDVEFADAQDLWYEQHGLDVRRRQAMQRSGNTYRPFVSGIPAEPLILKDGESWVAGPNQWQVITVGGHAPEMICLYCAELKVLIAADQLLPSITPNVSFNHYTQDENPLLTFLKSLIRLKSLPDDVLVLPSHGLPFRGLHKRIEQLQQHHEERFSLITAACTEASSATDMLSVLFSRELDFQQLMFAMGESIAHMRYLASSGDLCRISDCGRELYLRSG